MNEEITLCSLIEEQKKRIKTIDFIPDPPGYSGCSYYEYKDMDIYQKWLAKTRRYLGIHFPKDKDIVEFESESKKELSPNQQQNLLAILEAFLALPEIIENNVSDESKTGINVTASVTNSNNQSQSMAINLFVEAIKDDLTGRQIKELKLVVADENGDLKKARPKLIQKLLSFGENVASNIVANLLTNPSIWSGL